MALKGKKILLGVSGSIAAYKAAPLVRLLKKAEAEVQVVLTASASEFVTPLTLATLTERPALNRYVKNDLGEWNNHVALGLWADALLIAPASANTLAKMANGHCDNLLLACYLSARCPVWIAPAMDLDMFAHEATQTNIQRLQKMGCYLIDAEEGELASGLSGKGRMAEPEHIVAQLTNQLAHLEEQHLKQKSVLASFAGKKVLITLGPTREPIDPVRYITNASSGKMGAAIASAFIAAGAQVQLVHGPVEVNLPAKANKQPVQTAAQMYEATQQHYPHCDIAIFTAAVADYTPAVPAEQKIKKQAQTSELQLVKTKDIAFEMGKLKQPHQLNIGFALETENGLAHARQKLEKKNFDMVVLNSLTDAGAGFGHSTNKVSFISSHTHTELPLMQKSEVAEKLLEQLLMLSALQ
jgi:phosphopantothenoylcysteine decarboxylase/phosphopantothenate--cysteine ligase